MSRTFLEDIPEFLEIQRNSFLRILKTGLIGALDKINPISTTSGSEYGLLFYPKDYVLVLPETTITEAFLQGKTYGCKIYVPAVVYETEKNLSNVKNKIPNLKGVKPKRTKISTKKKYGLFLKNKKALKTNSPSSISHFWPKGGQMLNATEEHLASGPMTYQQATFLRKSLVVKTHIDQNVPKKLVSSTTRVLSKKERLPYDPCDANLSLFLRSTRIHRLKNIKSRLIAFMHKKNSLQYVQVVPVVREVASSEKSLYQNIQTFKAKNSLKNRPFIIKQQNPPTIQLKKGSYFPQSVFTRKKEKKMGFFKLYLQSLLRKTSTARKAVTPHNAQKSLKKTPRGLSSEGIDLTGWIRREWADPPRVSSIENAFREKSAEGLKTAAQAHYPQGLWIYGPSLDLLRRSHNVKAKPLSFTATLKFVTSPLFLPFFGKQRQRFYPESSNPLMLAQELAQRATGVQTDYVAFAKTFLAPNKNGVEQEIHRKDLVHRTTGLMGPDSFVKDAWESRGPSNQSVNPSSSVTAPLISTSLLVYKALSIRLTLAATNYNVSRLTKNLAFIRNSKGVASQRKLRALQGQLAPERQHSRVGDVPYYSDKAYSSRISTQRLAQRLAPLANLAPGFSTTRSNDPGLMLTTSVRPFGQNLTQERLESSAARTKGPLFLSKKEWVCIGILPLMTPRGHFIINGSHRIVVSQMSRAPGLYYQRGEKVQATIVPSKGAWLRISLKVNENGEVKIWVRITPQRKMPYKIFIETYKYLENLKNTKHLAIDIDKGSISKKLDPFTPSSPSTKNSSPLKTKFLNLIYKSINNKIKHFDKHYAVGVISGQINRTLLSSSSYTLGSLGRKRLNERLGISEKTGYITSKDISFIKTALVKLLDNNASQLSISDDIDHLENRRVRTCGELLQSEIEVGMVRLKKAIMKGLDECLNPNLNILKNFSKNSGISVKRSDLSLKKRVVHDLKPKSFSAPKNISPKTAEHTLWLRQVKEGKKEKRKIEGQGLNVSMARATNFIVQPNLVENKTSNTKIKVKQNFYLPKLYFQLKTKVLSPWNWTFANIETPKKTIKRFGSKGHSNVLCEIRWPQRVGMNLSLTQTISEKLYNYNYKVFYMLAYSGVVHGLRLPFYMSLVRTYAGLKPYSNSNSNLLGPGSLCSPNKWDGQTFREFPQSGPKDTYSARPSKTKKVGASFEKKTSFNFLCSPSKIVGTKAFAGALREFFGSNPLSQYMDQTNPLAEITHKRRLSSLGPGGVDRASAGIAIRGIHPSHYGRICPIETPEGKNAGLVNSMTMWTRVNPDGFLETPYLKVRGGSIMSHNNLSPEWHFISTKSERYVKSTNSNNILSAITKNKHNKPTAFLPLTTTKDSFNFNRDLREFSEETFFRPTTSPFNINICHMPIKEEFTKKGKKIVASDLNITESYFLPAISLPTRDGSEQSFGRHKRNVVDFCGVSPMQNISVATSLIPFLEHDDATRALMGSNMQRQAVPLIKAKGPLIRTGLEGKVVGESGHTLIATCSGIISTATRLSIAIDTFTATKESFRRSVKGFDQRLVPLRGKENSHVGYISSTLASMAFSDNLCTYIGSNQATDFLFYGTAAGFNSKETPRRKLASQAQQRREESGNQSKVHYLDKIAMKEDQVFQWQKHSKITRKRKIHTLQSYTRSNQATICVQRPAVTEGHWVQKGDLVGDCSASQNGVLALGQNIVVAYLPMEGFNFEDAIVVSDRLVHEDLYTSIHVQRVEFDMDAVIKQQIPPKIKLKKQKSAYKTSSQDWITLQNPHLLKSEKKALNSLGIIKIGSWVGPGDVLVSKVFPVERKIAPSRHLLAAVYEEKKNKKLETDDTSLRVPKGIHGRVINVKILGNGTTLPMISNPGLKIFNDKSLPNQYKSTAAKIKGKKSTFTRTSESFLDSKPPITFAPARLFFLAKISRTYSCPPLLRAKAVEHLPIIPIKGNAASVSKGTNTVLPRTKSLGTLAKKTGPKILERRIPSLAHSSSSSPRLVPSEYSQRPMASPLFSKGTTSSEQTVSLFGLSQTVPLFARFTALCFTSAQLVRSKKAHHVNLRKEDAKGTKKFSSQGKDRFDTKTHRYRKQFSDLNSNIFAHKLGAVKSKDLYIDKATLLTTSVQNLTFGQNCRFTKSSVYKKNLFRGSLNHKTWAKTWVNARTSFLPVKHRQIFNTWPGSWLFGNPQQGLSDYKLSLNASLSKRKNLTLDLPLLPSRAGGLGPEVRSELTAMPYLSKVPESKVFAEPKSAESVKASGQSFHRSGHVSSKTKNLEQQPVSDYKIVQIRVYIAERKKLQVGDKMSGRHGNKGIVSTILPREDMPYLPDGTCVDMVLNPLGIPSRMNVGQVFECLLGLAASVCGDVIGHTPFDEMYGPEASRSLVYLFLYVARLRKNTDWLFQPNFPGKTVLFDGRTGTPFEQWVTVGRAYMLKLIHMVDEKIHARSIGPRSLVTQQPVKGRARGGGQRLGEMELWALEGFGAAYILQEMLTVKSDDVKGRENVENSIIFSTAATAHIPETFKMMLFELRCLCLNVELNQNS